MVSDLHGYSHCDWYPKRKGTKNEAWPSVNCHPPCTWWQGWNQMIEVKCESQNPKIAFVKMFHSRGVKPRPQNRFAPPKGIGSNRHNVVFESVNTWIWSPKPEDQSIIGTSSPDKNGFGLFWSSTPHDFGAPEPTGTAVVSPSARTLEKGGNGWAEGWMLQKPWWSLGGMAAFRWIWRIFHVWEVWKCGTLQIFTAMGLGETTFLPTLTKMLPFAAMMILRGYPLVIQRGYGKSP